MQKVKNWVKVNKFISAVLIALIIFIGINTVLIAKFVMTLSAM